MAAPGAGSGWAEPAEPDGGVVLLAMLETLARQAPARTTRSYARSGRAGYSHSIVAGGFELMS
jgi:hypothetical protein